MYNLIPPDSSLIHPKGCIRKYIPQGVFRIDSAYQSFPGNDTENFSLLGPKTQQIDNLVLGKLFVPKLISTQTGCYESPTMTMETMMVVVGR